MFSIILATSRSGIWAEESKRKSVMSLSPSPVARKKKVQLQFLCVRMVASAVVVVMCSFIKLPFPITTTCRLSIVFLAAFQTHKAAHPPQFTCIKRKQGEPEMNTAWGREHNCDLRFNIADTTVHERKNTACHSSFVHAALANLIYKCIEFLRNWNT